MTILLRQENISPFRMPDNNLRRSGEYISLCGWCGKIRVGNDWLGLGEAIGKLQLFDLSALPTLTHGLCRSCEVEVKKEMEESRA